MTSRAPGDLMTSIVTLHHMTSSDMQRMMAGNLLGLVLED
jgi:hypothetical protein